MKIKNTILIACVLSMIVFVGCGGGSIESDAQKLADIECEAKKIVERTGSGDMSTLEESAKLSSKAMELSAELEKKYTTEADKEAFLKAYLKARENCK